VYADSLMETLIPRYAPRPVTALDIGCGGGSYARYFEGQGGVYHGVDIFAYPTWETVQKAAQDAPLRVQFHCLPAEQVGGLPIEVDFSLSSSSLEHVDEPQAVIQGLSHLTRDGAYGLHIVPAPWTLLTYGKHGWRRFSSAQLAELFKAAEFEVVDLQRLGGVPSTLFHLLWITGLEDGYALQNLTLSALPFILYRINSVLCLPNLRAKRWINPLYRALLHLSLRLDPLFPHMACGYAILVRRRPRVQTQGETHAPTH
jgi:SAM-dependent methyltransferase